METTAAEYEIQMRNLAEMCASNARYLREAQELNQDLLEALLLAREYVARTHGVVAGAAGHNNLVLPDLEKIDAAIAKANGCITNPSSP